MKGKMIAEACQTATFCLGDNDNKYTLKHRHDYYYQIRCQLYCADCDWCDFVVKTEQDIHIERIYRDKTWWELQLEKLKVFYFDSLLPELACPRHRKGGSGSQAYELSIYFYVVIATAKLSLQILTQALDRNLVTV